MTGGPWNGIIWGQDTSEATIQSALPSHLFAELQTSAAIEVTVFSLTENGPPVSRLTVQSANILYYSGHHRHTL